MCKNCIDELQRERLNFTKNDETFMTKTIIRTFVLSLVLDAAKQTELTLENIDEIVRDQEFHFQRLADLLCVKFVDVEIPRDELLDYARKSFKDELKKAVESGDYDRKNPSVSELLDFNPLLFAESVEDSTAFVKTLFSNITEFKGSETINEVVEEIYLVVLSHVIESIRELDIEKVHEYINRIISNTCVEKSVPCYFNYEQRSPHAFSTARTRTSILFSLVCGMVADGVSKEDAKQALVQIEDIIHHRLVVIVQSLTDEDIQSIKAGEMFGEIKATIKTIH